VLGVIAAGWRRARRGFIATPRDALVSGRGDARAGAREPRLAEAPRVPAGRRRHPGQERLRIPEELYATLSIYLLLAIGLKGGVALAQTPPTELVLPAAAVVALGCAMPLWCTWILQRFGRFARADAAAIAAHYGSVSAVTFLAATAFLDVRGEAYEGYVPALVALLEVPAIVVALLLARSARCTRSWPARASCCFWAGSPSGRSSVNTAAARSLRCSATCSAAR
jgi:hypothetical protein